MNGTKYRQTHLTGYIFYAFLDVHEIENCPFDYHLSMRQGLHSYVPVLHKPVTI